MRVDAQLAVQLTAVPKLLLTAARGEAALTEMVAGVHCCCVPRARLLLCSPHLPMRMPLMLLGSGANCDGVPGTAERRHALHERFIASAAA